MPVRELAIKEDKTPLLTLVRAFSSPVLFCAANGSPGRGHTTSRSLSKALSDR